MTPYAHYQLVFADGSPNKDVLPTPYLISEGTHTFIEAYEEQEANDKYPALWRARDDKYDARNHPGPIDYRRVRVIGRCRKPSADYPEIECDQWSGHSGPHGRPRRQEDTLLD